MRTAEEMADFIIKYAGEVVDEFTGDKTKTRPRLAAMFRPIEHTLKPAIGVEESEDDNVSFTIVSTKLTGLRTVDFDRDISVQKRFTLSHVSVAAAFTANRCVIAHIDRRGRELVATIPYDAIIRVNALPGKLPGMFTDGEDGQVILDTSVGSVRFYTNVVGMDKRDGELLYEEFAPYDICKAVTYLVAKYKQEKYAAEQGTASQAPQAAPPAGAGLPPETVEALKQLKDLLDAGILTQEEFDAKKRQLLGL